MQVVVDSLLASYERIGKGKVVLVLHGWGDSSKGWLGFCRQLDDSFELIIPDLPGFGSTQTPPEAWGLTEYAAFVAEFLKKLKVNPYAIIGHSNGGAIAIRGLAKGLLKADKLILLDSAGIRSQYKGRTKAVRLATKAGKALTAPLPAHIKRRLRRKVYQSVGSDMLVAAHLQETFKRVVTDDVQADAADVQVPALLIYGEDDLATPVHYGQMLHNLLSGSRLEIVPEAGHFVHVDKPEKVRKAIQRFLA